MDGYEKGSGSVLKLVEKDVSVVAKVLRNAAAEDFDEILMIGWKNGCWKILRTNIASKRQTLGDLAFIADVVLKGE
jgi:hypothetical protein